MQEILRTRNTTEFGLTLHTILGLNIFTANGIRRGAVQDPRIVFLQTISRQFQCSAHVGGVGLADLVEVPEEIFGSINPPLVYESTKIGLQEGTFYAALTDNRSCFFPAVSNQLWDARTLDNEGIQYLVECGAIALYVDFIDSNTLAVMKSLLSDSNASSLIKSNLLQEQWLRSVANLYSIVVVAGDDGLSLEVYTTSTSKSDMISSATDEAVASITASPWYVENCSQLHWDTEEGCLKL